MNKKSLILSFLLVLIVFLSATAVSAENSTDSGTIDDLLSASEITIETTDTNDQIQTKINSLNDGDTLNFQTGEYKDICLYVNKSITINGNGSTLYGYDKPSANTTPDIIMNKTSEFLLKVH